MIHTFTCDERDELGYTFLDGFLGVLGDFGICRQRLLHDARDVGNGEETVLDDAQRYSDL